jgi:hypothetical protein
MSYLGRQAALDRLDITLAHPVREAIGPDAHSAFGSIPCPLRRIPERGIVVPAYLRVGAVLVGL